MKPTWNWTWLLLGILIAALIACAPAPGLGSVYGWQDIEWSGNVWVESLEIQVNDDGSAGIDVIVMEPKFKISTEVTATKTSLLYTTENYWSQACGFKVSPVLTNKDAYGFKATSTIKEASKLKHALDCISPMSHFVSIDSPKVQDRFFWTDYRLDTKIAAHGLNFVRRVQLALPGETKSVDTPIPTNIALTRDSNRSDMAVWRISPKPQGTTVTEQPSLDLQLSAQSQKINVDKILLVVVGSGGGLIAIVVALIALFKKPL